MDMAKVIDQRPPRIKSAKIQVNIDFQSLDSRASGFTLYYYHQIPHEDLIVQIPRGRTGTGCAHTIQDTCFRSS